MNIKVPTFTESTKSSFIHTIGPGGPAGPGSCNITTKNIHFIVYFYKFHRSKLGNLLNVPL